MSSDCISSDNTKFGGIVVFRLLKRHICWADDVSGI